MKFHTTALAMLAVVISVLNWLLLGYPKNPPPEARAGAPLTEEQCAIQDRLLKLICRFLRASAFDPDSLGRCSDKFDRVAKFIQELPAEGPDVDLTDLLHDLRRSFDPYSRPKDKPQPPDISPTSESHQPARGAAKFPSGPLGKENGPRLVHPSKEPEGPGPIFRAPGFGRLSFSLRLMLSSGSFGGFGGSVL